MNYSDKIQFEALTYDDVLLLPAFSNFLPHESNTKTKFTKNIELNISSNSNLINCVKGNITLTIKYNKNTIGKKIANYQELNKNNN